MTADHEIKKTQHPRTVLILVGPTASGKTTVSLSLAKEINGEIVSADSRQLYRHMDIGTAKPNAEQLASVPHHYINTLNPDQDYNAGIYGTQARVTIDDIFDRGKIPLVVGGSGLYIQSLTDGLFDGPPLDADLRKLLYHRMHVEGEQKLYAELLTVDPVAAAKLVPANTKRVIRALEVFHQTGTPISILQQNTLPPNFKTCWVGIKWDRNSLYERINDRVEVMFVHGFLDEVRNLQKLGYPPELNSLQTVGYKECFDLLAGKSNLFETKDMIKKHTRWYAKRQITWFNHIEKIKWYSVEGVDDFTDVVENIKNYFTNGSI